NYQNDDYIEKKNLKSCKVEDSGVKKKAEDNGNNLNNNDHNQVKNLLNKLRSSEKMKHLVECFRKYCNESNCTHEQWNDKLESLLEPEEDQMLKKLKRLLFEMLPIFFDAFSLLYDNPLKNHNILEEEYINIYIYFVLKKALRNKAVQASTYRKLVMRQEECAYRSDGLAYITTEKQYIDYVINGTKEMSNFVQNA
ncbi:490_t:CDS:2, partial [Gigaspora rosea]